MADNVVRSTFIIDADIKGLQAQIQAAIKQVTQLNMVVSRMGNSNMSAINKGFTEAATGAQMFSHKMVDLNTNATNFGNSLQRQQLTMRQYRQYMNDYNRSAVGQRKVVSDLAREQVRLGQATAVAMGGGASGRAKAMVFTPTGLANNMSNAMQLANKETQIFNRLLADSGTAVVNWGKNTQWAGRQLMVGLTIPMVMFGQVAKQTFIDVDKELVRMQKVYGSSLNTMGQSTDEIRGKVAGLAKGLASEWGVPMKETAAMAADMAATGKEGAELLGSTREAVRLSVLGEVDRQTAMAATLSLQTAFNMNTKELAESINFLNAVENSTSTTLEDLAIAIPKAGPVVKALGGDVKDLAILMTAMKEGGIDAAEGANAIKSGLASMINPTRQASEMAKGFGIDLKGIVEANKGELMPTMIAFRDELMKIDEFGRAQIIEQLFGKYQFARISALFDNLGQAGSQSLTTMGLAGASAADLAAVAANELEVLTNSTSKKFERAVESFKAAIQPIGETMTVVFTVLIDAASSLLEVFDRLPGPVKTVFAGILAFIALAGPLLMLAGVFGNLFGTIIKGIAMIKSRASGGIFEMMTEESVAAEKAGNMLTESFFNEKAALKELIAILAQYEAGLRGVAAESATLAARPPIGASAVPVGSALHTRRLIDYEQPDNKRAWDTPSAVFEAAKVNSGQSGTRTNKEAIPMPRFLQLWRSGAMDENNNPINPVSDPTKSPASQALGTRMIGEAAKQGRISPAVHQDMMTTQALLRYQQLTGPGHTNPKGSPTGFINPANAEKAFMEVQTKYNRHIEQLLQSGVDAVAAGTLNPNDQGAMRRFFMGRIATLDTQVQGFLKAHFNDMFDLTGKQVLGSSARHLRGKSNDLYGVMGIEPPDPKLQHISHQAAGKASRELQMGLQELDRMLALEMKVLTKDLGGLASQISRSGDGVELALAKTGDDIVNGVNVIRAKLNSAGNLTFAGVKGGATGAYAQLYGALPKDADKAATTAYNNAVKQFATSVKQNITASQQIGQAADTMLQAAAVEGSDAASSGAIEAGAALTQIEAGALQNKAAVEQNAAAAKQSRGGGGGMMGGMFAFGSAITMASMLTGNESMMKVGMGLDMLAMVPMMLAPLKAAIGFVVSKFAVAAAFMMGPWGLAIAGAVAAIIAFKVIMDKITKDEKDRAQANSVGDSTISLMGKTPTSWDQALTSKNSKVKRTPSEVEAFQKKVSESDDGSKDIETLKGVEDKKQKVWLEQKARALVLADPTEAGVQFAQDYIAAIAEEAGDKAPTIAESVIASLQQNPVDFADAGFKLPGSDKKGQLEEIQFRVNLNESSLATAKQMLKDLTAAGKGEGDDEWDYWNSQITFIKNNLVELKGQVEAAGVDFISMGSVASDAMRAAATPAEKLAALLMTVDQNTTAMQASGQGFKDFKDALIAGSPELEKYIKNSEDLNDIIQVLARMSDIDINVNVNTNAAARIAAGVVAGVTGLQAGFKTLTDPFNELMSDESARKSQPGPTSDEVGDAIDAQIKGIEKTTKAYDKAAKARDKQHEAEIEAKQAAIDGVEKEIDAIDDQIKAINEAADAKKKEIDAQRTALEIAKEASDFYRDQQKLTIDYETAIASGDYAAAAGIAVQREQGAADFGYEQTQNALDAQSQAITDEAEQAVKGEEAKKEAKQAYIETINLEIKAINDLQEREQEANDAWHEAQQNRIDQLNENKEAAQAAAAAEQAAWAKTYSENKKNAEAFYAAEQANLAKLASEGKLTTAAIEKSAQDTEAVLKQLGWSDDRAAAFGDQMQLSLMTSWAAALKPLGLTPAQMDAVVKQTATRANEVRIANGKGSGGITMHEGGEVISDGRHPGLKPDETPRILQHGEYVFDRRTVRKLGGPSALDKMKMHDGGYVGPGPAGSNLAASLGGAMIGMMQGVQVIGDIIGNNVSPEASSPSRTRGGNANAATTGPYWGYPPNIPLVKVGTQGFNASVNKVTASAFQSFLNDLTATGYKIRVMYGYANRGNTSDPSKLSQHAYGNAIDINPAQNPYGKSLITDMPSSIQSIIARNRMNWGGNWSSIKDAMHFEWAGPLKKGGKIRHDNTLAALHRGEKVLTEPNTANLDQALKNLARVDPGPGRGEQSVTTHNPVYNLNVNVAGTNASPEAIANATMRAIWNAEKTAETRIGVKR